jgi:uncharacterized repeat protein (TIGR01451 family)
MLSTAKIFSRFYGLIAAAIVFSPFVMAVEAQSQPISPKSLPKDWCGRLWGVAADDSSVIWDNPINATSSIPSPPNVAPIPPLPIGAIPANYTSAPGYATLAIHARSGTLYLIDRGSAILYQYSMSTGVGWTGTLLPNLPIIVRGNTATNFNKMTVIGNTLLITNSLGNTAYTYNLDPATGTLASVGSTAQTLTFDNNTLLPDGTRGNPPGTTNINGGDIAQDEYGDVYMLAYDSAGNVTPQYAYFYKLVGTTWIFQSRVQKATNTDQFAGLAFYNDTIYVKGTTGRLSRLALTRVGNNYDWAGNASTLIVVGDSTGVGDLASCGIPALDVTKTQAIYTDQAGTIKAADQTKIVSGQYIKYTVAVANLGDAWARDSYLKDELPAGVTYVPNSATENGTNLTAATYPFTNRVVTSAGATTGQIRLPFLGNSNTATYTYFVKVNGTAPNVRNTAEAGYLNPYPSDPVNCGTGLNCGRTTLLDLNPSIFGTVWNDTNGSAANTFNNIFTSGETGTNTGTTFYALLVNSTGNVVESQVISSNGTYAFSGLNPSQTGLSIRLSTTAGNVGSAAPAASIPTNWKNTSPTTLGTFNLATIDINNNDFGLSLPAGTILVKRITAINGQQVNPYDKTALDKVEDSIDTTNDDPTRKWPVSYIKGAINGGQIRPGDTIEYTVYYLNDSGADTKDLNICDPIRGKQTYVTGSIKMLPGGSTNAISLTDDVDLSTDRASYYLAGATPTNCNANNSTISGRDNGGIAIQITGTGSSIQPDLPVIPAATNSGTPASSYGSFKFTTKIDPISAQSQQN